MNEFTSDKIKKLREVEDISQLELAVRIGVSLPTIQNWENERTKPNRYARRKLREIFIEKASN